MYENLVNWNIHTVEIKDTKNQKIFNFLKSLTFLWPPVLDRSTTPNGADPPEPEELIKALQDLENSASSDAIIREKIARLPPELSESSHLDSLQSYEDGQKLLVKVNRRKSH